MCFKYKWLFPLSSKCLWFPISAWKHCKSGYLLHCCPWCLSQGRYHIQEMLNKLFLNEQRTSCTHFPLYQPMKMWEVDGSRWVFHIEDFVAGQTLQLRTQSLPHCSYFQQETAQCHPEEQGQGRKERAAGNSIPWRFASRKAEWVSYLSSLPPFPWNAVLTVELSLCVGPLSQVD